MDETTAGWIGMIILFCIFGLPIAAALFFSVVFFVLDRAVKVLTRLGYAAIVPAGLYALLSYMNGKMPGSSGPIIRLPKKNNSN